MSGIHQQSSIQLSSTPPKALGSKLWNTASIFKAVQEHGPIERKTLQRLTGLSWGAISQFTSALIECGLCEQRQSKSMDLGKPPTLIDISASSYCLLGIELSASSVRVAVVDLKGRVLTSGYHIFPAQADIAKNILDAVEGYIGYCDDHAIRPLLLGISSPGNVDSNRGILHHFAYVQNWLDIPLRSILQERFRIPADILHDSDCALMAEKYFGKQLSTSDNINALFIYGQRGISMSIMLNGKIYMSSHSFGEFGHVTAVPGGTMCSCGKRGCLEMYASLIGIERQYQELLMSQGEKEPAPVPFEELRQMADRGNSAVANIFHQAGDMLGLHLANISSILDPDYIFLCGPLFSAGECLDHFTTAYKENVYFNNNHAKIYLTQLGKTSLQQSAALYALDHRLFDIIADALAASGAPLDNSKKIMEG